MSAQTLAVILASAFVVAFAARKGGLPEQWIGGVIAAGIIVDQILVWTIGNRTFENFSTSRFLIDAVQLVLLVAISMRANRVYPLIVAASQLMAVVGNLAALLVPNGLNLAYWAMTQLPLLLHIVVLYFGIRHHAERVIRIGRYNCWSPCYKSARVV